MNRETEQRYGDLSQYYVIRWFPLVSNGFYPINAVRISTSVSGSTPVAIPAGTVREQRDERDRRETQAEKRQREAERGTKTNSSAADVILFPV